MTKAVFYHIYVVPKEGVSVEEIEKKIDLALDWFRYDDSVYVVYSTSDIKKWMTRLRPLVEKDGRLFVCELNHKKRNGWMNKSFWNWLRKER